MSPCPRAVARAHQAAVLVGFLYVEVMIDGTVGAH